MANYYTDFYNNIIDNADNICDFLTGSYMNRYENMTINCDVESGYVINGMKFVQVAQYRKLTNSQESYKKIKSTITGALEGYHNANCSVGYFVVSYNGIIGIYYASGIDSNIGFDKQFTGKLPDTIVKNQFMSLNALKNCANSAGVITGVANIDESVVDNIINKMINKNCIFAIIAKPFSKNEYEIYRQSLRMLAENCTSINSYDMTFGTGTKRNVKETFPNISRLKDAIDVITNRIDNTSNELWKTSVWFSGETRDIANDLGQAIVSAFNSSEIKATQRFRKFNTTTNPFAEQALFIPNDIVRRPQFELEHGLMISSLVSLVSSNELAGYMQLPTQSYNGINVISTEHSQDDVYEYDTISTKVDGITIGTVCDSLMPYNISLRELVNHLLIIGGTGCGKTNTVMTLLSAMSLNNVPFCVIESSKKEYWKLASTIKGLKVYSSGNDAIPLRINPLAPEEGVYIGNHIDDLIYAFCGAFDMETPTKAALQNLIVYTYKQFGWDTNDIASNGFRKYPTIKDMILLLPQFCKSELTYGNEVGSNIQGAISNRLNTLIEGTIGNIVNCDIGISAKELCSKNTIVELDDLSVSIRPFVANLLVVKMNEYLRQKDADGKIKNVIVIEEAHNIFSEISNNSVKTSKDLASEYFSNLLSEIRAYGTALAIVDQGASRINSNAIANTGLKIIHALSYEADAKEVSYALNLSAYQMGQLTNLGTGEAVIARRGDRNVCKVKISKAPKAVIDNISCLFCNYGALCGKKNRDYGITNNILNMYAARIYQSRFNKEQLLNEVSNITRECGVSVEDSFCVLGYILSNAEMDCSDREKRRIICMLK